MGKIRITQIGGTGEEEKREKRKVQREEKKKREGAGKKDKKQEKIHLTGMKGGERVKTVGADSEEELEKLIKLSREVERDQDEGIKIEEEEKKAKKKKKIRVRGKNYQSSLLKLDASKQYDINEAVPLLRKISYAKFDETVEVHINTTETGLRGKVNLPHGTGKKVRVMVADESNVDDIVKKISEGKIDFDALVAHPKAVPKLAKVAKFLGPRGLMPNPKTGTISEKPDQVAKKLEAGELNWKTESQEVPVIHQAIGKLSFKDDQIVANYQSLIKSVDAKKIGKVTLKSTMSPGIKIK